MKCKECGKTVTTRLVLGMCQGCYNYFRKGGQIHPLPLNGTIAYDNRGCVICHICGRAHKRLGSHIRESHNMTIAEYKEKFGLCNNTKTTEASYSNMMHNYAIKYEMDKRLLRTGKNTRIKKGEVDKRKGKPVRLQECLDKKRRIKKENNL